MDNNEYWAIRIQVRFGVNPKRRNEILFDCGSRLAMRLRLLGIPIVEDRLFWGEFTKLFCIDDSRILEDWESRRRDYATMKEAVVTDSCFEYRLLENIERATADFDCLSEAVVHGRPSQPPAPKKATTDTSNRWRKRLIAAIGGYLSLKGERADIDRIKAVACRAAKKDDFNRISVAQLRSLYNAFLKQQADLRRVQALEQTENH